MLWVLSHFQWWQLGRYLTKFWLLLSNQWFLGDITIFISVSCTEPPNTSKCKKPNCTRVSLFHFYFRGKVKGKQSKDETLGTTLTEISDTSFFPEEEVFRDKEHFRRCHCSLYNKTFWRGGELKVETGCKSFRPSEGDRKCSGAGEMALPVWSLGGRAPPWSKGTQSYTLEWSSLCLCQKTYSVCIQLNPHSEKL